MKKYAVLELRTRNTKKKKRVKIDGEPTIEFVGVVGIGVLVDGKLTLVAPIEEHPLEEIEKALVDPKALKDAVLKIKIVSEKEEEEKDIPVK